jgi:uncharacterized protein (TIGR00304 family)
MIRGLFNYLWQKTYIEALKDAREQRPRHGMESRTLFETGLVLVFAGFALALISAFFFMLYGTRAESRVRGGGIVMLGPFPIVFGTDKGSVKVLIVLSIVLMIIVLAFMWFASFATK